MNSKLVLILSSMPSEEDGKLFAEDLVRLRLAECVKVFPTTSFYIWDRKLVKDHESVLLIKARKDLVDEIERHFSSQHPYSIPEFIVVDCSYVSEKYLNWVFSDKTVDPS
ncbi:MAG: divalent-cation tolerance protein CutA [Deltaproteobacteria bacterium]|nr:divalent-cation tolerance protein CutA [Deltaproteobacteria bacterium]